MVIFNVKFASTPKPLWLQDLRELFPWTGWQQYPECQLVQAADDYTRIHILSTAFSAGQLAVYM